MRKILLITVVGLLFFASFQSLATEQKNHLEKEFNIAFQQIQKIDMGSYLELTIDNAQTTYIAQNHYIVPTKIETFTFPYGTTIKSVSVTIKNIDQFHLEKKLQVTPPARLLDGSDVSNDEQIDSPPVAISDWYSYDIGAGIIDGVHSIILKIQLFPIQYNPMDNTVEYAEDMSIDILYDLPTTTPSQNTLEEYELIILSPTDFSDELQPLVSHKIDRNISTKLVTLSEIKSGIYFPAEGRDEPEQVKYFIKNAYEQWGIRYVLLVGGVDEFPVRYTHVFVNYGDGDDEVFVTDLYYADLYDENGFCSWDSNENDVFGEFEWGDEKLTDEIDIYPDVAVGRLAAISEEEVTTAVNKIISYETAESYKQEWFTTVLYCGGDTHPGDDDEIDEGEYLSDYISGFMDGFSENKLYVTDGTLRTVSDISDGFKDGSGFMILAGHANPSSWSTHPHENANVWIPTTGFRNTHAASLNNQEKLPVLLTEACSPFKYASSDNCLGWSFVSNPNGGAIAGFGSTGLSWGYVGSGVISGLTSKVLIDTLKSYREDGAITPGEMYVMGLTEYYRPNMDGGSHKSAEEWQLLGDPSLGIAEDSMPPNKPEPPVGPSSGSSGETYAYSAVTTDPEGDDVYYLFDWGDGTDSGWLGPFGSGKTCESSHTWSEKNSYEIRVKAQDFHGVISDWSDPLPISMPHAKTYHMMIIERLLQHFPLLQFSSLLTSFLEIQ